MDRSATGLFAIERAKGRSAYKLYALSMVAGIIGIWWYRARNIPGSGEEGRWAWIGLFMAEVWFGFYWIITQSARWNPIYRRTFTDKLSHRDESELPAVDVFVCTADPYAEPPAMVISTVLSVMAYDYPPEKINVYLSDDAGSELTFYALWEAAQFAVHWLPFCRRHKVEPRSPAAYYAQSSSPRDNCDAHERSSMKILYEEMVSRIYSAVMIGKIPEGVKKHKGFSEWNSGMTKRNHQAIVQILIDGRKELVKDNEGTTLPTLVYMAREKRPEHHHNFKAGAMNALIRISSEISNSPLILNVDCDMYSNNSDSIRDALCFFLDEENGQDIGFVQYPQNFDNLTKNDHYANSLNVINEVELPGADGWGGPLYIGTGCFHRREILCGRKYTKDYKEDWKSRSKWKLEESTSTLEERAKSLATCTYEDNTLWGKEIGLKYDCAVEDVITGLIIQSRGWKSAYFNPPRKAFLGVAPTTLGETLIQHKRWSEGNLQILLSKYCPFILGHGKLKLGHQMAYCVYGLWAANSFPTIYYSAVPSLCFLRGISLFPMISSLWFIPFAYVTIGNNVYAFAECLLCGSTLIGWWNAQRMWLLKRITSYLFGAIHTSLRLLGVSKMGFVITAKVADSDASKRYQQEVLEFGSSSAMFCIIAINAMLNLLCLLVGLPMLLRGDGSSTDLEQMFIQVLLCATIVGLNLPVYEALFWRRDNGSLPSSMSFLSLGIAALACLAPLK